MVAADEMMTVDAIYVYVSLSAYLLIAVFGLYACFSTNIDYNIFKRVIFLLGLFVCFSVLTPARSRKGWIREVLL